MPVSSEVRRSGPYVGNGVTTQFFFDFVVQAGTDLLVIRTLAGVDTVLQNGTDYNVAVNGDQANFPGGSITMTTAPSGLQTITLSTALTYTQGTQLSNSGGFYPAVINNALDRVVILIQQLRELFSRSLRLPLSTPAAVSTVLPAPQASRYLAWNSTGTAIVNAEGGGGGGGGGAGPAGPTGPAGVDGLSVQVSNPAILLPSNAAGTVLSYSTATGRLRVFLGAVDVTTLSSLSVVSFTSGLTGVTIEADGDYFVTGGMNSLSIASVTFRATFSGATVDATVTLSKVVPGTNGANATFLYMYSDRQQISYDAAGALDPSTQTTTFTVTKQGLSSSTVTVSMTDAGGTAVSANVFLSGSGTVVPSGVVFTMTGDTITMTAANFNSARGSTQGVIVTVIHADGVGDKLSVLMVRRGAVGPSGTDAVVMQLSKASHVIVARADGSVPSYSGAEGFLAVFAGAADVTLTSTLSAVASSGVTGTINTSASTPVVGQPKGYYRVTAMTVDTGTLTFSAVYNGVTYTAAFTVTKARGGYEISGTLPTADLFAGRVVFNTADSNLYRYSGSAWVREIQPTEVISDSALLNPSFEAVDPNDPTLPARWRRNQSWGGTSSTSFRTSDARLELIPGAGSSADMQAEVIPVRPGETWFLSVRAQAAGTNAGTSPGFYVRVHGAATQAGAYAYFLQAEGAAADGVPTPGSQIENLVVPTVGAVYECFFTIPAGCFWASPIFLNYFSNTGHRILIDDVIFVRQITTRRIKANAITADNIGAGEITAGKLGVDSIVASNIVANEITTNKINGSAVTTPKIAVGAVSNFAIGIGTPATIPAFDSRLNAATVTITNSTGGNVTHLLLIEIGGTGGAPAPAGIGLLTNGGSAVTLTQVSSGGYFTQSVLRTSVAPGTYTYSIDIYTDTVSFSVNPSIAVLQLSR